jgi:hypothetical protein
MKNSTHWIYKILTNLSDCILTSKQFISQDIVRCIISTIVIVLLTGCQTGKQPELQDYIIQQGDLESIIQTGNWFKFYSDRRAEPYSGTLNPGRMTSMGREYHILKFVNHDKNFPFAFQDGDTMSLILDGRPLHLTGYNINKQKDRISAYYEIDKWDMVDIGNASSIKVIIQTQDGKLTTSFSNKNIFNYRYFSAKYILKTDDIPALGEPVYKQPVGFLGGGAGTGFEFWLGYYTNFIYLNSGSGDYLAAGMGMVRVEYSRYNRFPVEGYLWDGNFSIKNYYINFMYGLTYPSPFGNWSFELGMTYQYYFYDESWNTINTGTDRYPTYYRLTDDEPFEGSVIGVFFQAGGLWAEINGRKNWAVGIAIPIPWW